MYFKIVCFLIITLLGAAVISCGDDVSGPAGKKDPDCGTELDLIDFGRVSVGTFKDSCTTISAVLSEAHIADTIVIDCPGFHFVDKLSQQIFDTLIYDLTYPDDTTFCIRFEPEAALPTHCEIDRGTDCGDLNLAGTGLLPDYISVAMDFPSTVDLYDVFISMNIGAIVCGDSGLVAASMDLSSWLDPCSGPQTTSALRGMGVYMADMIFAILFVGGGGESNGLMFGNCDPLGEYQQFDYFTSALYCFEGDEPYGFVVGRGADSPDGANGFSASMSGEDYFTLSDKTSEISDIDGPEYSNVWAVLSQPWDNLYHFNGSTWELGAEAWMVESLYGVWVHESGEAFAVGSNGAIYHYTGLVWEDQSIEFETVAFHGVWGFSPADVYVVGEHATIYHYNGSRWGMVQVPPEVDVTLNAVHGTDEYVGQKLLLAVGRGGTVIAFSPENLRGFIVGGGLRSGTPDAFDMLRR